MKAHIFRNGSVEVGTGEPGYKWVDGYSEAIEGGYTNPVPLKEQRAMAKRDGKTVVIHRSEAAARAAVAEENSL